jgi:hypothetical protein
MREFGIFGETQLSSNVSHDSRLLHPEQQSNVDLPPSFKGVISQMLDYERAGKK